MSIPAPAQNVGITHRLDPDSPKDILIQQLSAIANSTPIDVTRLTGIGLIMPADVQGATAIRMYVSMTQNTGYVPLQAEGDSASVFEDYAIAASIGVTPRSHKLFPWLWMKFIRTTNGTAFTAVGSMKS